jgi:YegS/Rv2252/BmrU family lipid kinase
VIAGDPTAIPPTPAAGALFIIVNPTSGGGAGERMPGLLRAALDARGAAFEIHRTERAGHAMELAHAAACRRVRTVVAVGGDGTVHETANGLLRARAVDPALPAVLGIVPVGTGNDFVKMIDGAARRDEALRTIVEGRVRRVDVGLATWGGESEYFVNGAGTGIDVEVVRALGVNRGTRGPIDYIVALLRALRRYDALPVRIIADGQRTEGRVMMVAVTNGRCIGGTFRICPQALVDDGLLDMCTVLDMPLGRSLRTAARIVRGTHAGMPSVYHARAASVELSVPDDTPLFFQLDGELREPVGVRKVRFEVKRAALPVLTASLER